MTPPHRWSGPMSDGARRVAMVIYGDVSYDSRVQKRGEQPRPGRSRGHDLLPRRIPRHHAHGRRAGRGTTRAGPRPAWPAPRAEPVPRVDRAPRPSRGPSSLARRVCPQPGLLGPSRPSPGIRVRHLARARLHGPGRGLDCATRPGRPGVRRPRPVPRDRHRRPPAAADAVGRPPARAAARPPRRPGRDSQRRARGSVPRARLRPRRAAGRPQLRPVVDGARPATDAHP